MDSLVAIGSAAIDIKTRLARPPLYSTDVPGQITLRAGGVARNVAENLARLNVPIVFAGILGDDPQARMLIELTHAAGVDVRPIARSDPPPTDLTRLKLGPDLPTATLSVMLGPDGRQIAGAFSGDILDALQPHDLDPLREVIRAAPAVVCDCGLPVDVLITLRTLTAPEALFYCNPASVTLAPRIDPVLDRCDLLTCNHLEASALTGVKINGPAKLISAAMILVKQGVKRVVVTFGARGLAYADELTSQYHPARPTRLVDATGAGDALAAAMLEALLRDEPMRVGLLRGLAAAAITCESEDSVSRQMSMDAIAERTKNHA